MSSHTLCVRRRPAWLGPAGLPALIVLLLGGASPGSAADDGPSFDCTKATTADEKLICTSDDLSRSDRSLAQIFRETRDSLSDSERKALVQEQRKWVDSRNRRCGIDRDTVLQPRIFISAIPCFADQMQERGTALYALRRAAETKRALGDFRASGRYSPLLFEVPADQIDDDALIAQVPSISGASEARTLLDTPRAVASDRVLGAIVTRFPDAAEALMLSDAVCRPGIAAALARPVVVLNAEKVAGLLTAAAKCATLSPLRTFSARKDWIAQLSATDRDEVVTNLRLPSDHRHSGTQRGSGQLALERMILGDPSFPAVDWTAGQAIAVGAQDPARALKALARFDSSANLIWRVIYLHVSIGDPAARKAAIVPLLQQLKARLTKPGSIDEGRVEGFAEQYDGSIDTLQSGILEITGDINEPLEDLGLDRPSCSLLVRFPEMLAIGDAYYGGNRDNFTPRFYCDDFGAPLPKSVDTYFEVADDVYLGGRFLGGGMGTMRYAWGKEALQARVRMRLLPQTYLANAEGTDLNDVPLAAWSNLSLWNHVEYRTRARPLFLKARKDLADYYEAHSGLEPADALTAAHLALWEYVESTKRGNNGGLISPVNQLILDGKPVKDIAAALD
jgi:uncharacterized protein YecT (DUF1311 family)